VLNLFEVQDIEGRTESHGMASISVTTNPPSLVEDPLQALLGEMEVALDRMAWINFLNVAEEKGTNIQPLLHGPGNN
jgi:hypothetical protein